MIKILTTIGFSALEATLLLIGFSIIGCNNRKSRDIVPRLTKADTTLCVGLYKADSVNIRFDQMRRVVFDIKKVDPKDSMRLVWAKDTLYLIVKQTPVDSALSLEYKIPMKDSLGKPTIAPVEYVYNKRYVRDGWGNADSAAAELKRIK